ncbi:hypothetical protein CDAR_171851 [Caerostris darwini]|uniref:Uncharacterized protein n=1 Tax=Caerostris darwini TaxID=1538125 RepID=A0AAV4MPB9_9ARAC|nr:hypothetical protein CDAR_171851 [Caerostris darwini]
MHSNFWPYFATSMLVNKAKGKCSETQGVPAHLCYTIAGITTIVTATIIFAALDKDSQSMSGRVRRFPRGPGDPANQTSPCASLSLCEGRNKQCIWEAFIGMGDTYSWRMDYRRVDLNRVGEKVI